ncbi:MAG: dienelactone hydrolase family protein [Devosiaceae bacterium]|nr:dienelactone hydrolase family protein [Devosiaceae bacterium MH13]
MRTQAALPALALACTTLAALATPAAAEIVGETHTYTIGDLTFEGYVATNSALEEPKGTVLIVHDWDGLTDYEVCRAEMLAALGYTAFAIDVYSTEVNPTGFEEYRAASGAMYADRQTFRERLLGAIDEAANITGGTENIIMMGYCFGGAAVLEAARAGADIDGFVAFHAGLGTPADQDWASVAAPIQFYHGTADPVASVAALAVTLAELEEAGVAHSADIFGGARHSFTVFGSRDYLLTADQASWSGLQTFLNEQL